MHWSGVWTEGNWNANTCTNKSDVCNEDDPSANTRTNKCLDLDKLCCRRLICTNKSRRLQRRRSKFKHLHEQIRRLQTKFIHIQTLARTNQDVCNEVYPNSNTCTNKSRRLQRSLSKFKHLHEKIKTSATKFIQIQTLARTNQDVFNEDDPNSNTCTNK